MKKLLPFPCRKLALLLLSSAVPAVSSRADDYAFQFDGAKDWVDTAITGTQLAGSELTVEFWFRGSNIQSAFHLQALANGDRIVCGSGPVATPVHRIRIGAVDYDVPIDAKVHDGNWHHVALTYKQNTTGGIISYVDGTANPVTRNAPNAAIPVIPADVILGSFNGVSEFTSGRIDEMRIWKKARTAADIFDAWQSRPAFKGSETGLTGYFGFNEADGTEVANLAGGAPAVIQAADSVIRYGRVAQDLTFAALQRAVQFSATILPAAARVAHWKFDEAAGTTTAPAEVTGTFNGTFKSSTATYGAAGARADSGTAIDFNGAGGAIFPAVGLFKTSFTAALWVKPRATTGTFFSPVSYSGNGGFTFGFDTTTGALRFALGSGGTVVTAPAPGLNQWVHLAATHDATTGETAIWVNGERKALGTGGHIPQNAGSMQIVAPNATLDDMVVLDGALDAANMQLLMTQGPLSLQSTSVTRQYFDAGKDSGNDNDKYDFRNALTAELYVSFDSLPAADAALVSRGDTGWSFDLGKDGKLVFRTPTLSVTSLTGKTALTPGRWYHVAAVWDGIRKRNAIYINGAEDNSVSLPAGGLLQQGPQNILIGAKPTGFNTASNHFIGRVDEVRLWAWARTPDALAGAATRLLNGSELGLAAVWSFDSFASATSVPDGRIPSPPLAPGGFVTTINANPAVFKNGALASAMVPGVQFSAAPANSNSALLFESGSPYPLVSVPDNDEFDLLGSRTIEAWIYPDSGHPNEVRTILSKGTGWRLILGAGNKLLLALNNGAVNITASVPVIENRWQHVAARLNQTGTGNGTLKFEVTLFIGGVPVPLEGLADGAVTSSVEIPVSSNTRPLLIGTTEGTAQFPFFGALDEVRVWALARKLDELEFFSQRELITFSGLAGYWNFNSPTDTMRNSLVADSSGKSRPAAISGINTGDWTEGGTFGVLPIPGGVILAANPGAAAAGLWRGTVTLTGVSEAAQTSGGVASAPTPSGGRFSFTILLHVDANGTVRLLKDVIIMKTGADTSLRQVLVTNPALISNFSGVQYRGDKLVGTRYSASAYDFDSREAELSGGLGGGYGCYGSIRLGASSATNPYRHKYHPDHGKGFSISRELMLTFPAAANYTADRLLGSYAETVTGPHKSALTTTGYIELQRLSGVSTLNQ